MNVTTAHLSIILEIAAFFLVTLELYGEQRLCQAAAAIRKLAEAIRRRAEAGINLMFGVGALTFSVLLLIGMFLGDTTPSPATSIIALVGTALVVLPLTIAALLAVAWLVATLGALLFSKTQLRGLMLLVGALLFVLSKALAW